MCFANVKRHVYCGTTPIIPMPSLTSASCGTVIVGATSGPACCELERHSLILLREIKASLSHMKKKKRAYIYIYLYKYVCVSFLNKLSYLCQLSPSRNIRRIKDFLLTFCCLEMLSITRTRGTFRAYCEYQKIQRSGICILITASRYTIPTVHFMEEML